MVLDEQGARRGQLTPQVGGDQGLVVVAALEAMRIGSGRSDGGHGLEDRGDAQPRSGRFLRQPGPDAGGGGLDLARIDRIVGHLGDGVVQEVVILREKAHEKAPSSDPSSF